MEYFREVIGGVIEDGEVIDDSNSFDWKGFDECNDCNEF